MIEAERGDRWVRTSEAAKRTGMSQVTIWRWAVDRKIPSVRPGGPGTWLLVDLDYLLREMVPRRPAPRF